MYFDTFQAKKDASSERVQGPISSQKKHDKGGISFSISIPFQSIIPFISSYVGRGYIFMQGGARCKENRSKIYFFIIISNYKSLDVCVSDVKIIHITISLHVPSTHNSKFICNAVFSTEIEHINANQHFQRNIDFEQNTLT